METRSALGVWRGLAGGSVGRRAGGFTLIELIVVLALVGLVTVLAAPNLQRLYEGFTRKAEQGRILNQIAGLGREAMLRGRAYAVYGSGSDAGEAESTGRVSGFEAYPLDVPEGWEVSVNRPLLVRANGVCLGATMTLVYRGATAARVVLEAPYCRVSDAG